MPPLLPSEVARLVYGQLVHCNCQGIAERFLNESPHLEECREFVNRVGVPSFITKAYGLPLHQILERYLEMWNLIMERTNNLTPDTRDSFADPVDALKFLLAAYDQTVNEVEKLGTYSDEMRWKLMYDNETLDNFSLHGGQTMSLVQETRHDQNHRSHFEVRTDDFTPHDVREELVEEVAQRNHSPPKLKRQNNYLHTLHTKEMLKNPGSKKRLKVLKPRQPVLDRSSTTYSAPHKAESNPNLSEDKFRSEDDSSFNGEACVHSEKLISPEQSKRTNMQLRSSSKIPDNTTQQTSSNTNVKLSKKRKCSRSPERESMVTKQLKMSKSMSGKENEAQVDFTKIPQLLIEDPKWPELIAENINKKILESPQKKIDTLVKDKNNVIESIVEKTLEDQLMDAFIQELLSCASNVAQEKSSAVTNVNLLDDNLYETNLNSENNTTIHRISENEDIISKLSKPQSMQCTDRIEEICGNIDYTRLHEDMNEFIQFNNRKETNVVSNDQSDIIVLETPETDQVPAQHSSNFMIESQIRAAHSNFVVCSTDDPLATNGKGPPDEVISLCTTESDVLQWNLPTTSSMVVTTRALTSTNTKLQICGPITSLTKPIKKNYRPIAPKPNSAASKSQSIVGVFSETNSHQTKSKSLTRTKK